jgi:hypothetical protein
VSKLVVPTKQRITDTVVTADGFDKYLVSVTVFVTLFLITLTPVDATSDYFYRNVTNTIFQNWTRFDRESNKPKTLPLRAAYELLKA